MRVLKIASLLRLMGRSGARKLLNHSSWIAVASPTDSPRSVRNCYVIKVYGGVFVLSLCSLEFYVGRWAFAIALHSFFYVEYCSKFIRFTLMSKFTLTIHRKHCI